MLSLAKSQKCTQHMMVTRVPNFGFFRATSNSVARAWVAHRENHAKVHVAQCCPWHFGNHILIRRVKSRVWKWALTKAVMINGIPTICFYFFESWAKIQWSPMQGSKTGQNCRRIVLKKLPTWWGGCQNPEKLHTSLMDGPLRQCPWNQYDYKDQVPKNSSI